MTFITLVTSKSFLIYAMLLLAITTLKNIFGPTYKLFTTLAFKLVFPLFLNTFFAKITFKKIFLISLMTIFANITVKHFRIIGKNIAFQACIKCKLGLAINAIYTRALNLLTQFTYNLFDFFQCHLMSLFWISLFTILFIMTLFAWIHFIANFTFQIYIYFYVMFAKINNACCLIFAFHFIIYLY